MPRRKKEVVEVLDAETSTSVKPEEIVGIKKTRLNRKIYYFSVVGHVNDEGDEIKYSFPSMNNDFNCQWDIMGIVDRAALKFYQSNPPFKNLESWPLRFKFYIDPKAKAVYECDIELAYAPVFSKVQE